MQAASSIEKARLHLKLNWMNVQRIMDMWQAYQNSVDSHVPDAEVVHDRFHISKHLNEAVDQIRRTEHKTLMNEGNETLKGTRHPLGGAYRQCQPERGQFDRTCD